MFSKRKIIATVSAIALIVVVSILFSVSSLKRNAQAYLYAYPLVLMDQTRQAMSSTTAPKQIPNHFTHVQIFPDHTFRNVVRPNNDTLYSVAWLDLSAEPLILSVPDTQDRYYVMPFMDAWTNVFASVGKRTTGTQAGHYALTGPEWQGNLPEGVEAIPSPTNMVWIIGRIQTNGSDDIANVTELQKSFLLTPLSNWASRTPNPHYYNASVSNDSTIDPSQIVEEMSATEFFNQAATLMGEQAPLAADKQTIELLKKIGIKPGQNFDTEQLNFIQNFLLEKSKAITQNIVKQKVEQRNDTENGWTVYRDTIGNYGTHYDIRAAVALVGLGALSPQEASYPNTLVDSQGQELSGEHRYKLHFPAGQTPPVNAFWSLSMYDKKGFFIDNPIKRYSIGDRNALKFNADGSLDIFIQTTAPEENNSNWLPSPNDTFALTLRLYLPQNSFLDGSWTLPAVERID